MGLLSSLGGGFSGNSSGGIGNSAAQNTSNSDQDSRNSDAAVQGDYGVAYSMGDNATLSDMGAIREAFGFAGAADASQRYLIDKMLSTTTDHLTAVKDSYGAATQSVIDSKVADTKYLVIAGMVVVLLFGLSMVKK